MAKTKEEIKAYSKAYSKAYRESHKEQVKAYRESHKEEQEAYNKSYKESHKEEIKTYNKEYQKSHIKEIKTCKKKYRASHIEEYMNYRAKWIDLYPEKQKESVIRYSKKKVILLTDSYVVGTISRQTDLSVSEIKMYIPEIIQDKRQQLIYKRELRSSLKAI